MKFRDALLIPCLLGPLVTGAIMGFTGYGWFYFLTNFVFDLCFGGFEFLSVKYRKKSISQDIASTPNTLFWSIIGTWTLMQVGVAVHWIMMR